MASAPASRAHRRLSSKNPAASSPCSAAKYPAQSSALARGSLATSGSPLEGQGEPPTPLAQVAVQVPELPEHGREREPEARIAPTERPAQGGSEVVVLELESMQPSPLLRPAQLVLGVRREVEEVLGVPATDIVRIGLRSQAARARALGSSRASRTAALRPGLHLRERGSCRPGTRACRDPRRRSVPRHPACRHRRRRPGERTGLVHGRSADHGSTRSPRGACAGARARPRRPW